MHQKRIKLANANRIPWDMFQEPGVYKLDYNNPDHEAFFWEMFGEKELIREQFPAVYQAFIRSKSSGQATVTNHILDGMVPISCGCDGIYLEDEQSQQLYSNELSASVVHCIKSSSWIHTAENMPTCLAVGELRNTETGEIYDSFCDMLQDVKIEENFMLRCPVVDISRLNDQKVNAKFCINYTDETGAMRTYVINESSIVVLGGTSIIKNFTMERLHPDDTKPQVVVNPIQQPQIILYGRTPANNEKADRIYPDLHPNDNGQIAVHFPLSGTIQFAEGIEPIGYDASVVGDQLHTIQLTFSDDGSVYYNYNTAEIASCFTTNVSQRTISFEMNDDWNTLLDTIRFGTNTTLNLAAQFPLQFKVNGQTWTESVSISSRSVLVSGEQYFTSSTTHLIVPQFSVRWGCLAEHTKVKTLDGGWVCVEKLTVGSTLCGEFGDAVTVTNLYKGREPYVIHIETDDHQQISLTSTHPVKTADGIRAAKDIRPREALINDSGAHVQVKFVHKLEYDGWVYGIETSPPMSMIHAEHFLVGSFDMQNNMPKPTTQEKPIHSAEINELIEQWTRLAQYRFGAKEVYTQGAVDIIPKDSVST